MKKFIPIVVVSILVLSGLGAAAFSTNISKQDGMNIRTETTSVAFSSQPTLSEKDGFIVVQLNGATTQSLVSNRPVLPIYVKTYQIPFRSTDIQLICTVNDISSMTLTQEVIPARIAPISTWNEQTPYVKDSAIYGSNELYPGSWYTYDLGAGRNENNQQVTFVKVICYPVRYSPMNNEISLAGSFDIKISYTEPQPPARSSVEDYDMVIIAPEKFSASLQPLIDFKNGKGVITKFKSVESILSEYDGFDAPEQIKYFIKNEYDTSNITYVLLVGGLKTHLYAIDKDTTSAGWKAWRVPVRYVNMPQEEDEGCLSDLYYGCLYNATGAFDSWDSNGDGVYAAWNKPGVPKDKFDMYPEVYVSRITAVNDREVKAVVKKITTYENTGPADKSWYHNFVGVGGKTFAYYQGKPDGEYLTDLAYNYTKNIIPDLTLTKVYSTNRDTGGLTPIAKDIAKSFNDGAGFVDFEGHGWPGGWNTIWFDGTYPDDWTGGITIFKFAMLRNGDELPVVVIGGCHNAMYNVSIIPTLLETAANHQHFCYGMPTGICLSAGLVTKAHGGAIAATGCTGYGFGTGGDPNTLSGALEMNFFYQIGQGTEHLAAAHGLAITKYINENDIDQIAAFCITNWALIGDPSLQFGGYSS